MKWLIVALALTGAVAATAGQLSGITVYGGLCDASGAAAVADDLFAVADDEDNRLRIYHAQQGGAPAFMLDTSSFLRVDPREPELDLEGAARLGDRIYWITSHGRNREAKYRESRLRFFATDLVRTDGSFALKPVGRYYAGLLLDLFNDPRLARYELDKASHLAPKAKGGLNIEGLCSTADGKLLIGFRNPIPKEGALVIPLLNPAEVIEGKRLRLGDPMHLDLGGRGIRSMAQYGDRFIIIGGAYDAAKRARLYLWDGRASKPEPINVELQDFNPEALAAYPNEKRFQIFSDDGTRLLGGKECKTLPADQRQFRAAWVAP